MKILTKTALAISGFTLCVVAVFSYVGNRWLATVINRHFVRESILIGDNVSDAVSESLLTEDYLSAKLFLKTITERHDNIGYIGLMDNKMRNFFTAGTFANEFAQVVRSHPSEEVDKDQETGLRLIALAENKFFDADFPILNGTWTLHIGFFTTRLDEASADLLVLMLLLDAFVLTSGFAALLFINALFIEPIKRMTTSAAAVMKGDFSQRLVPSTNDELGNLTAIFGQMENAIQTSYRGLKQKAIKAQKNMELVISAAGEGIVGLDAEGRVIFANPAAAKMLGYNPNELISKSSHDAWHYKHSNGEKYQLEDCPIHAVYRTGVPKSEPDVFWKKSGEPLHVEYISTPIVEAGKTIGAVITFKDISERIKNENKIRDLNDLRNKFIQIISHQLRTPINAVRWNLESLLSESLGKLKDEQKEFVRLTYDAEMTVIKRLDDLLTAMDIEEGRVVVKTEPTSLENLLSSTMAALKKDCELKKLRCEYLPPDKPLPDMELDGVKMRTVLDKLMQNAIIYTPEGGQIKTNLKRQGEKARLEIIDTGIGIPKQEQKHIFTRFFRASNAASVQADASGLGLSIAKYYVEQHGGTIGFTSEEGKGSAFWLELPLRRQ